MATKIIRVHIDDVAVEVELKAARKADGLWRAELMGLAAAGTSTDPVSLVGFYLYPTCVAAVKRPGWVRDITLEDFIDKVDEQDMDLWCGAAYELNPQWQHSMQTLASMTDEESKKTGTPSSGLTQPMEAVTAEMLETSPVSKN